MWNFTSKFFDMDGKITRKEFILRYIVLIFYILTLSIIREIYNEVIMELLRNGVEINITFLTILTIILVIFAILGFVAAISLQIRRLNDLKKSTALVILAFIPIVNMFYLVYLATAKSKQDRHNKFTGTDNIENEILNLDSNRSNITEDSTGEHSEIELDTKKNTAKLSPYLERILTEEQKEIMPDGKIRGIAPEIGHGITSIHLKPAKDEDIEKLKLLISSNDVSNTHTIKNEVVNGNPETINQENSKIEKTRSVLKNNKKFSKRLAIAVMSLVVILLIGYFNFFYYPHNGRWETELYSRKVILDMDKGEGTLKIGHRKGYDVIVFDPNKKNTTMGINGSSNNVDVNRNVLVLELENLYTSELGELNEVLYLKRNK